MSKIFLTTILTLSWLTIGCSVSSSNPVPDLFNSPQNSSFTFADQKMTGKIFGQDWTAQAATITTFGTAKDLVALSIYGTNRDDICANNVHAVPYITMAIPSEAKEGEIDGGVESGAPLVFTGPSNSAKNVLVDAGRIKISNITSQGFKVHAYAKATDEDGTISEVNGYIDVVDCRKQVPFTAWDEFNGWFKLVEFEGRAVRERTAINEFKSSSFYHRESGKYVRTLVWQLFSSVSENSDGAFEFGPMQGLGTTTMTQTNGTKTLTYTYHGPIYTDGLDVTLNLDMTVVSTAQDIRVTYTVEVPKHISKTTRNFKLRK